MGYHILDGKHAKALGITHKKPVLAENLQVSPVPIVTGSLLDHILELTPATLIQFNILQEKG